MSEGNEARGEISIALEGVNYVLRPAYTALVAIERQTGRSLEQLAVAAGDGSLPIEHAAIVVAECARAQGRAIGDAAMAGFNATTVGECLVDTGMMLIRRRLELLLYLAVTGGYTAQGEAKAGTPTPAIPAAA